MTEADVARIELPLVTRSPRITANSFCSTAMKLGPFRSLFPFGPYRTPTRLR